jgi:hypothetical protein
MHGLREHHQWTLIVMTITAVAIIVIVAFGAARAICNLGAPKLAYSADRRVMSLSPTS